MNLVYSLAQGCESDRRTRWPAVNAAVREQTWRSDERTGAML
jgi:hypothetical protein